MYYGPVPAEMLGNAIRETIENLFEQDRKATPGAMLYAEKQGGFQCRTCCYSVPVNATHGRCAVVSATIHLDEGCCVGWAPDPRQLHLYQEKEE
jgi:hypothetical protein